MSRIYGILIAIFFLSLIGPVKAQNNGDHLEPVASIYDIYDFQFEYYSKVRKVLFKGLTDSPEIRFQIMPSFTPESVLDIEFDRENSKYYIVYHVCEKMIWFNKGWETVKVNKHKKEIDKESVELIKSLFDLAIAQTKFSEKKTVGLDGENYYFSVYNFGLRSGTIWSPPDGTKMGKLVDIGYCLVKLATSKEDVVTIDTSIREKTESLINELK